jgi:hypothetical protein
MLKIRREANREVVFTVSGQLHQKNIADVVRRYFVRMSQGFALDIRNVGQGLSLDFAREG